MDNVNEIIRQKISNHPINETIERYVVIRRIADNADVSQIVISGHVEYFKDGQNVTSTFKSEIDNWIVGNHYEVELRDENNEVVLDEETQEPIKMPAFDYFQAIILANQIPLLTLLSTYIINDDEKRAFNF